MPFLMHGEDVDPEIDIFDREAMFIERYLSKWTRQFPGPALHPGASVVEGRRRFRAQRGAAGRRHDHALSPDPDPHRLARLGAQALHVLHAGDQDREGPRGAAQGRDLGRSLLFPRHRFRAASDGEEARGQRHPRPVQCAGRDRDLRQGVRGGRRARQARSLCLAQRPEALSPAAQRGDDHARKDRRGRRRRRSRSRARTRRRWSIAAAKRSSGRWWRVDSACHAAKRRHGGVGRSAANAPACDRCRSRARRAQDERT